MFVGSPEGNYDRLLDFSRAVTGNLFFVPSVPLLEGLADGPDVTAGAAAAASPATPPARPGPAGSLNIGSLKGASGDG
jgi:putative iron-dependent peroxidase